MKGTDRMRIIAAALLALAAPAALLAQTPPPAAVAALPGHYSVETTDIGTMLDDPAAKAVIDKHIAGFSSQGQVDMARSMTLKSIQQYAGDQVSDKVLADIQTDLNRLPAKSK